MKKVFMLIFILFIIIVTIVFSILYRKNSTIKLFIDEYIFRKNVTENTLPKISMNNSYSFSFNNHIVVLDKNVLTFYNQAGSKTSTLDIEISNPIFETAGNYLCIAEKNGNMLYVLHDTNIVWQKKVDGTISQISINQNGYVSIAISDTTYKNICKVYDVSGSELFTTYLSQSYIIDSSISDDNKFIALAEANFSGINVQSNIKIISIDKALSNNADAIYYNYVAPVDSLIINIEYCNSNNLVCLYDNHIDIINDKSTNEVSNFENSNVLFADISNKIIQIEKITSNTFSSCFELQIIDPATLEKVTYSLDKEPSLLVTFGNIIAINFGTEVLFLNNSGWLVKDYVSSQEIQSIVISNDLAGIVFKDKLEFLNL